MLVDSRRKRLRRLALAFRRALRRRRVVRIPPAPFAADSDLQVGTVRAPATELERLREYERAVERLDHMVAMIGPDYRYLMVNRAFLEYVGRKREHVMDNPVAEGLDPGQWKTVFKPALDRSFQGHVVDFQIKDRHSSRGERELSLSFWPIEGAAGVDRVACLVRDITAQKRAERMLRELSSRLLSSGDDERRRVARELHDSTAQTLAALRMNISVVHAAAAPLSDALQRCIVESASLADQCLREIRTMAYTLHPPEIDALGLASALHRYIDGFVERSGVEVELQVPPSFGRLPPLVEMTVFRIVQECLTNIQRHSGSRTASIRLARVASELVLEARDAGRGLGADASAGIGIASMRERLMPFAGRLEVDSRTTGTTVRAWIPLPRAAP
jgi:PAS domain S-box-containing protein